MQSKQSHNTSQSNSRQPNPQRFNDFQLLADETGFTIPNCNHTFYFDVHGGWFDEYENYYNANGEPCTPPSYTDEEEEYHPADNWANEYDDGDDDDGDDLGHYDKVFLNVENRRVLANYLKDEDVEVELKNLNFRISEDDFENFLVNKKIEWIEFEFEYDNYNRFKGICYIKLDKPNAEKLIEFNGSKVFDRELKIFIQKKETDEEVEDIHEIGAGINLAEIKAPKEEEKLPEKPHEMIFQRNQGPIQRNQEPPKNAVDVSQLEKTFERSQNVSQKAAPQTTGQNAQTKQTAQNIVEPKKNEEAKTKQPAESQSPTQWGNPLLKKNNNSNQKK